MMINKGEVEQKWPIVEVYDLDYYDNLTEKWKSLHLIIQTLLLMLTIVIFAFFTFRVGAEKLFSLFAKTWQRVVCASSKERRDEEAESKAWRVDSVGWYDIVQFVFLLFGLSILLAYLVVLVIAVVQAVSEIVGSTVFEKWYAQQITTFSTFAFVAIFPRNMKAQIMSAGTVYTVVFQYLMFGFKRRELCNQLTVLLEQVRGLDQYENVHIVSYSFGSIIAIDTLYPIGDEVPSQYAEMVKRFVTLGCPADLIRTYLPRYYYKENRQEREWNFFWTNIFIPADVFASNFMNVNKTSKGHPTKFTMFSVTGEKKVVKVNQQASPPPPRMTGIPDKNIPFILSTPDGCLAFVTYLFTGLAYHGYYWDDTPDGADVSKQIVKAIFDDHWVLKQEDEGAA